MNKIVGFGLAAAAVIVALVVGVQLLNSPNANIGSGEEPTATPTPTIEPTPEPTPSPSAEAGLPEGPVLLAAGKGDSGETLHPPLTVTIPAPGWVGEQGAVPGGILLKNWGESDGAGMIVFARTEYYVYGDPCSWQTTVPEQPVTTVDEFVEALAAQPSRNASDPVDITLGGYSGKSIRLEVPNDADFSECDNRTFASYSCGTDAAEALEAPCGFHARPGETNIEYILDVDGMIVAWHTGYADGAPAEVVSELEAIVQSARFDE